jgi:hypothetical protein
MRASATGQLSQEELLSARQTMTEKQYSSEFECDPFAAILGAYYGKDIAACETEGRITTLPPESGCRFIPHGTLVTGIRLRSGSSRWLARK